MAGLCGLLSVMVTGDPSELGGSSGVTGFHGQMCEPTLATELSKAVVSQSTGGESGEASAGEAPCALLSCLSLGGTGVFFFPAKPA